METADGEGDEYVLVEHAFEYTGKDGRRICIRPNERYQLLRRSTEHWWHVRREPGSRPFYLPAQYVRELPRLSSPNGLASPQIPLPAAAPATCAPEPLTYDYKFVSIPAETASAPSSGDSGSPSEHTTGALGRFSSFHSPGRRRDPGKRSSLAPGLPTTLYLRPAAPIRTAQSLDDLARTAVVPISGLLGSSGSYKACSVAGSWVSPRPLAQSRPPSQSQPFSQSRSDSENIYESIQDVRGELPEEKVENSLDPVYVNVERQQRIPALAPASPSAPAPAPAPAPIPISTSPVWETHTDLGSGRPYYYNPSTGETTWESPFGPTESASSPATSLSPLGSPGDPEAEWDQYWDEESRRVFFYNPLTGETAWEESTTPEMQTELAPCSPMDQRPPTPEADYPEELTCYPEEDYSPVSSYTDPSPGSPTPRRTTDPYTPPGWSCHISPDGQLLYTNLYTQEQWMRSEDEQGKPYFYNPSDSTTQWELPQVPVTGQRYQSSSKTSQNNDSLTLASPPEAKSKTLDKAGVLYRTKTADKGKRLRKKNWSSSWTVLEGGILTFFKESKASTAGSLRQPSNLSTPEYTVDLRGATLNWATKDKSSKKNVLELRSRDSSEYLIQHDSETIIGTWYKAIIQGIQEQSTDPYPEIDCENSADFGSSERLGGGREKEEEKKHSISSMGPESDSSKVRHKLRKFLLRRPTLQSLREKGYIKDQVFGCALSTLCERENSLIPRFVQQCIRTVESRGLDIDGLYRISGNLATIQKLRYKVDHDERLDLDDGRWEDVHVITGALKLFFRELPEPLFPFSHFHQFISAIKLSDQAKRSCHVRDLVHSLPAPNQNTMRLLFQHLCRVIEHKEENRMSVQSVAIVFGPTLLRPEFEEGNMPMTMVFQNQVVELILQQCRDIFPQR
ncbi:rho GTPase-activating protein 27 isoform X1 [Monodelphis domestica]|uniref:rho GTPase-activating protein 27 isoform X1 n=1 Tax=Monodelphis domestica TaxID=13616 RepID=UPI0024E1D82F|nr:rho GTPase-activating protein 27 isoform X1 [Monodelphis domestica]XP_007482551.2 rho GTPase-activating protein 27 isoform X1 [Monodelphis domestica]